MSGTFTLVMSTFCLNSGGNAGVLARAAPVLRARDVIATGSESAGGIRKEVKWM
jgi:hypothetical protein